MNTKNSEIGKRIKLRREELAMTQEELGRQLLLNKSTIQRYESGKIATIKLPILLAMAEQLNVDPSWLALKTDDKGEFTKKSDNNDTIIDELIADAKQYSPQSMIPVPVVGKVAAGYTCLAETEIIGYELVDRDTILEGYEYMWLKVKGDSMEPMILEGDLVLVRLQRSVNSGEYGVVIVDEEDGLVKRIELGNCKITLISNNPYYPPREFRNEETQRVRIVGKVIESKRKF